MGTSSAKKVDRDEDEKNSAAEEEEETESTESTEEEDEDEDEDQDEDEEEKPAAKAASARSAQASGKRPAVPRVARTAAAQPVRRSGLGKSLLMFVVIVGGLAAAFALLGQETNGPTAAPKWKAGQSVDVEITLVASDKNDLACASATEMAGKHCGFEAKNKPWSKGSATDDKAVLRPYTTVDRVQFLAAGVWSQPTLSGTLPPARFSIKCKFTVDGQMSGSAVRWESSGPWYDRNDSLYVGSVSDCKLLNP